MALANLIQINKAEIRTLVPHSGLMCLLDEVTQWDDRSIVCVTNTHRDPANPLRRHERLSALHAFEYGAQAARSEEHTSELQSRRDLVCRLLLEKKKKK